MTIKLDGRPLSDFGIELLSPDVHPAAPQTRDITLEIPGRHGLYHFGSTLGQRNFSFECGIIRELDTATLQQRLRQFVAFLLDAYGKPREIRLTFDYEADKYYAVKFAGDLVPERFFSVGSFTLPFVAYDPMAYAESNAYDETTMYNNSDFYDSGKMYPNTQTFKWVYEKHYSGVYNYSSLSTDLILIINGTVSKPRITHIESGMAFILPDLNGQKLELNSNNFTVKIDGVTDLTKTSGDFLQLSKGENSLIFEGENPNATVTYEWRHKFI